MCDDSSEVDLGSQLSTHPLRPAGCGAVGRLILRPLCPTSETVCLDPPGQSHPALAEDQLVDLTPQAPFSVDGMVLWLREGHGGVQVTHNASSD